MLNIYPVYEHQLPDLIKGLEENESTIKQDPENNFTIEGHGIKAVAVFNGEENSLQVTILKKPFYVTEARIREGIEHALKGKTL